MPWPLGCGAHEAGGDRIRQDVDELGVDIGGTDKRDGAVAGALPEAIPAPQGCIGRLGEERVEVPLEVGKPGEGVGEQQVVMVREDAVGVEQDAVPPGDERESVQEDLLGAR